MTPDQPRKGRGAASNPDSRYHSHTHEACDDGWGTIDEPPPTLRTELMVDTARSVITYNNSPDVPFDRSINPYRGCEHGCIYCFARPTHAYLGLSPGLDFESRLFYKPDAPEILRRELAKEGYRAAPLALGINTDAYQPVERRLQLTRRLLEILWEHRHPVSIVTKSALIERDLDLLTAMARERLVQVFFSITTLDRTLTRRMEPRAAAPERRFQALANVSAAGVPTGVLVAPLIPVLTDQELEAIMARAREAGAQEAGYVLLRLPHEVKDLFTQWLGAHAPLKAQHIMNRILDARGGKAYDARFHTRMRGTGVFAELLRQRFQLAYKRLGFGGLPEIDAEAFRLPEKAGTQLRLF